MKKEIEKYCRDYMRFLASAKTERRAYAEAVRLLDARGFRKLEDMKTLKPGDRVITQGIGNLRQGAQIRPVPASSAQRVGAPKGGDAQAKGK